MKDDVGSSIRQVQEDSSDGGESPPPLLHRAMEEEVFDDMVRDLFPYNAKGSDNPLKKIIFFLV